jgi:flavin-dependent dehydrogenase
MSVPPDATTDILVIGGSIAGASAAYELAAFASVVLVERESQCGYRSGSATPPTSKR